MSKKTVQNILNEIDVKIDGDRPWDIRVKNEKFYHRVLAEGSLGLGESYMDGWWECDAIDQLIDRILRKDLKGKIGIKNIVKIIWSSVKARVFNRQNKLRALIVGKQHYDVGNDLYIKMLGPGLVYTCGYWKEADNLEDAQRAKMDLICQKLKLKPGMRLLDIGCGWGSLAKFAADNYGAEVVGITISKEQLSLARKYCEGSKVEIRLQDYRDVNEKFDRIVSVGMFEHVGYKNYKTFFTVANKCLKNDGLFLLHTIGGNKSVTKTDPWLDKYIFPNSVIPSVKQIATAIEGLFKLEDWHNFGTYYDKTLMAWHDNFVKSWSQLEDKYDERFYRMWRYYLLICAGSFRAHKNRLWQIVLSKESSNITYRSIR